MVLNPGMLAELRASGSAGVAGAPVPLVFFLHRVAHHMTGTEFTWEIPFLSFTLLTELNGMLHFLWGLGGEESVSPDGPVA